MAALFVLALLTTIRLRSLRFNWLFGAIMSFYLLAAGYALTEVHESEVQKDYFRRYEADAQYYVTRVWDCPSERENAIKMILELEHQYADSVESRSVSGKVIAYFQKTDAARTLRYGDLIAIPAPIAEVASPKNPEEFDYHSYLQRKGITGQAYLKDDDWIDLKTNEANPLYVFSFRFRDMLLASLQHCGVKDDEFGVAAAILLGYDEELSDNVRQNYVAAGSMHILCVSGLHVGIVYLLASFLLGFLNRKKWQHLLKQALLLGIIWFYALIAGLSPSILRAALMISFIIVGEMLHRKGFVINSIAASAFVLLCINPNNLFEIGFLLSYIAVLGIVILQRPIYNLLYVKNKFLDMVWKITTVALAAQIATCPFTLFYFNQFTTYFWLSNLFMTPISFFVVIGGMILLLVSWIPYINIIVGYLVWGAIFVMNKLVSMVERLPGSIIKGLYINEFELFLLLTIFLLLLLVVIMKKRKMVVAILGLIVAFMFSLTMRNYATGNQKIMAVYSLPRHTAVSFVSGNQQVLLADTTLMDDASAVDYNLKGHWAKLNVNSKPCVIGMEDDFGNDFLQKRSNLISFQGKLLVLWNEEALCDSLSYRLPTDYLLVMGKQRPDVRSILNGYAPKLLLIDASVPVYLAEEWRAQAEELAIPYYNIGEGAFVEEIGKNASRDANIAENCRRMIRL